MLVAVEFNVLVDIDIVLFERRRDRASAILVPVSAPRPSCAQRILCVRGHAGYSGPCAERNVTVIVMSFLYAIDLFNVLGRPTDVKMQTSLEESLVFVTT